MVAEKGSCQTVREMHSSMKHAVSPSDNYLAFERQGERGGGGEKESSINPGTF